MTTVINTSPNKDGSGGGFGFLFGIIALIIFVLLIVFYIVPALQRTGTSDTNIQVPDQVDVNVNTEGSE